MMEHKVRVWGFPTDHGGVNFYYHWDEDNEENDFIEETGYYDGGKKASKTHTVGEFLESVISQNDFLEIAACIREKREAHL